jgi:hypothetical protein
MTEQILNRPRVIDNDRGAVIVTWQGRQIRAWSYNNDTERRTKMLYAREYIEGWCDGNQNGLRKLFLPS